MDDREWDDYSRAIDPPVDAAARVRARLDRMLAQRRAGPVETAVTIERAPRAAAVILFAKSTALSLSIAVGGLGALHVGARVIAGPPAEPPSVVTAPLAAPSEDASVQRPNLPTPSPSAALPSEPSMADAPLVRPAAETVRRATPRASTLVQPSAEDLLKQETALIDAARTALDRGELSTALARLGEHAQRFPDGTFTDEREAFTAIARCRGAKAGDRAAIAAAFAAARPSSPLLARVRATCSDSATDSPALSE